MEIKHACLWCHKTTGTEFPISEDGIEGYLCSECNKANSTGTCIACGDNSGKKLYHGKCLSCNQIELVERIQKMSEVFGVNPYTMLREAGDPDKMTDEDFDRWNWKSLDLVLM